MESELQAKSPLLFTYSRKIWSGLAPMDVIDGNMIRVGNDFDGGYIMLDHGIDNAIAYSFGIGDEISWDLAMADRGAQIYQYDHTIGEFPRKHPNFHSYSLGLAHSEGVENLKTLERLLVDNGHEGRRDIILKCDIEGAEWKAFDNVGPGILDHFSQILIEMHDFQNLNNIAAMNRRINVLEKIRLTHEPIHVHANNWHDPILIGGVFVPNLIEVTYARKADHKFKVSEKVFPTEIDQPGSPFKPDIFLGALGYLR